MGQNVSVKFLQKLRPGGAWVLTAIVPDGTTKTIHRAQCAESRGIHSRARRQA
jgi:hypothetical protein